MKKILQELLPNIEIDGDDDEQINRKINRILFPSETVDNITYFMKNIFFNSSDEWSSLEKQKIQRLKNSIYIMEEKTDYNINVYKLNPQFCPIFYNFYTNWPSFRTNIAKYTSCTFDPVEPIITLKEPPSNNYFDKQFLFLMHHSSDEMTMYWITSEYTENEPLIISRFKYSKNSIVIEDDRTRFNTTRNSNIHEYRRASISKKSQRYSTC